MSRPLGKCAGTLALCGALSAFSCSERDRPPLLGSETTDGRPSDGGLNPIDVQSGDGSALCGDQQIPAVIDRPSLYFIIDRSGSMADPIVPGDYSKYESARLALGRVLRTLGHRLNYGAAVYPSLADAECSAGQELLPVREGDPPEFAEQDQDGPVLKNLLLALSIIKPFGGTPTAATLRALAPKLKELPGKRYVVLMTDGAPNCNPDTSCGPESCIPNIENVSFSDRSCNPDYNCCDPKNLGRGAEQNCVDGDASQAIIAELASAGIPSFIVGFPGSEIYTTLLDRLAIAGQTARDATPKYYPANDATALAQTLRGIGTGVAIQCDIELDRIPESRNLVNVYFDTDVVPYDETDGWSWTSDKSIRLSGAACAHLSSGDVFRVQILFGCPTVVK